MTAESIKSVNRDRCAQHLPRVFLFVCDVHWCTIFPDSIKHKSCEFFEFVFLFYNIWRYVERNILEIHHR